MSTIDLPLIRRRDFVKRTAMAGAAIGAGGKGAVDVAGCDSENIVALCDVDDNNAAGTYKKHPNAKRHRDFRVMLEKEKTLDAVTV